MRRLKEQKLTEMPEPAWPNNSKDGLKKRTGPLRLRADAQLSALSRESLDNNSLSFRASVSGGRVVYRSGLVP